MVDFNVNFGKSSDLWGSDLGKSIYSRKADSLKNNDPIFNFAKNSLPEINELDVPLGSKTVSSKNSGTVGERNFVGNDIYDEIEQPYEEFSTDSSWRKSEITDNTLSKWMELTGIKTKEEALKDIEQTGKATAAENKKKNEIMNNTRASNGMTYKEAVQTYMRLYNEYLRYCQVEVPWVIQTEHARKEGIPNGEFVGGMVFDVDPSKIEEHMPPGVKEQYHQAQQAIAELEKNEEFMKVAKDSKTHGIYDSFQKLRQINGASLRKWQDYAARNGMDPESQMNRGIKNPFDERWE